MIKSQELSDPTSCLNRAKNDEMVFSLLGRDVTAPSTIRYWCYCRIKAGKNKANDDQIHEALTAADVIEKTHGPTANYDWDNVVRLLSNHADETGNIRATLLVNFENDRHDIGIKVTNPKGSTYAMMIDILTQLINKIKPLPGVSGDDPIPKTTWHNDSSKD